MNVKYQIFVSSTFEDLKTQREQVVKAILEMGHIPVGMEMFSAADEEQWKLISRQIAVSDYYVVILAHRYGSTDAGLSFTEKEYDFAVFSGVPVLGYIIADDAAWPQDHVDTDYVARESLARFKEKVKKRYVSFWSTTHELYGAVPIALMKQMNTNPRIGWIRGNEVIGPEATAELARLSQENSVFRKKLDEFKRIASEKDRLERDRIIKALQANKVLIHFWFKGEEDWTTEPSNPTLYRIFLLLGPSLMIEISTMQGLDDLAWMLLEDVSKTLRSPYPIPKNAFQEILADFTTLGLVKPSKRKHLAKDTDEYWSLSPLGREILAEIRRARLDAGISQAEENSEKKTESSGTGKRTSEPKNQRLSKKARSPRQSRN